MNFTLEELEEAMTFFSPTQCRFLSENCIVALEHNKHTTGSEVDVSGDQNLKIPLNWSSIVNKNGYKETKKFTEKGAEALSFFLAFELTDYNLIEEAVIGTGVDYWLGYDEDHEKYDEINFFHARLEVSGILKETPDNNLSRRIREKKNQTKPTDATGLPAYVSIIEFSTPKAYFGKK